jgi:hypothetical protein
MSAVKMSTIQHNVEPILPNLCNQAFGYYLTPAFKSQLYKVGYILEVDILAADMSEVNILKVDIMTVDILEVDILAADISEVNILKVNIMTVDIISVNMSGVDIET